MQLQERRDRELHMSLCTIWKNVGYMLVSVHACEYWILHLLARLGMVEFRLYLTFLCLDCHGRYVSFIT